MSRDCMSPMLSCLTSVFFPNPTPICIFLPCIPRLGVLNRFLVRAFLDQLPCLVTSNGGLPWLQNHFCSYIHITHNFPMTLGSLQCKKAPNLPNSKNGCWDSESRHQPTPCLSSKQASHPMVQSFTVKACWFEGRSSAKHGFPLLASWFLKLPTFRYMCVCFKSNRFREPMDLGRKNGTNVPAGFLTLQTPTIDVSWIFQG